MEVTVGEGGMAGRAERRGGEVREVRPTLSSSHPPTHSGDPKESHYLSALESEIGAAQGQVD